MNPEESKKAEEANKEAAPRELEASGEISKSSEILVSPPKANSSSLSSPRNDKLVPLKKRGLESPVEFLTSPRTEAGEREAKVARVEEGGVVSGEVSEPVQLVEGRGEGAANTAAPPCPVEEDSGLVGPAIEEPIFREALLFVEDLT
jgi:hypothetical protein